MKQLGVGLTYYWPNISGVSIYAQILAEELVKKGNRVKVISSQFKKDLKNWEVCNGIEIFRIKGTAVGKGFIMWSYPVTSIGFVKNSDVVNCHLPSIESFWLALWAKCFGKKLVVTHHCEFGIDGPISNRIIAILSFPIHFLVYLVADVIVAYTEDYAQHSMFLRIFSKKLKFILPPVKIRKIKNKGKKYTGKVVGYVGRIAWEKGLDLLIEAMEGIEAKLILVGPYKDVVGDKTYEKIKKTMSQKVVFAGPIEHEKLGDFYNQCDCLVLPSTSNLETFGIVQAEAMKCGVPVVASNLPGVRVPVKMTEMGEICEVGDVDDLKNKINLVLKRGKNYYQKTAKNLDKFDYKKTVEAYEKLF